MAAGAGRNVRCSCGSGKKFKHCCGSGVAVGAAAARGACLPPPSFATSGLDGHPRREASVRDRNEAFLVAIADALQLDKLREPAWSEVKRAITSTAVRKINEAILKIWPPETDIASVLRRDDAHQMGFFSGDYRPQNLLNSIGRHLIYADRIALGDPFQYPVGFRAEYNPLLNPGRHRINTAKGVMVWFQLADLIQQGLVEIIRLPSDFDLRLQHDNRIASEELVGRHPELQASVKRAVRQRIETDNHENQEWLMLTQNDAYLVHALREVKPDATQDEVHGMLAHIKRRRVEHPFYLEGVRDELIAETSGSSVYDCLQVASISGAYMLTDLEPRWRQYEFLQREAAAPVDGRTRVAHSLQNIAVPMARRMDVKLAQRIREENQLGRVRGLLDKLMREAGGAQPLSESEARAFTDELREAIAEAKDEYASIDRSLLNWVGGESAAVAGLHLLASGSLMISMGALAVAGAVSLGVSAWSRRTFRDRYPAAMFMKLPLSE